MNNLARAGPSAEDGWSLSLGTVPASVLMSCLCSTSNVGSSDSSPFLLRGAPVAALGVAEGEEIGTMNQSLQVIISCIEELMAQDGLESEQKDALVSALKVVERFRRNATPSKADLDRIVRIVAEKVSTNFIR